MNTISNPKTFGLMMLLPRRWGRGFSMKLENRFKISDLPWKIIANLIIGAAKDGERDFVCLYNRAIRAFAVEDTSMLFVSAGQ